MTMFGTFMMIATMMLEAGVHPKVVSERLRHASIAITPDSYSHVLPGLEEVAADNFDRMISNGAEIDRGNVSKPLVEAEGIASERCRSLTCDHLIKSLSANIPKGVFESRLVFSC